MERYEPIKARAHGLADYGFVATMVAAPLALRLNPRARAFAWGFAATQGTINALTRTPVGLRGVLSLRTHGWLEAASLPAYLGVPIAIGAVQERRARTAWLAALAALVTTYTLTDWYAPADS